MRKIYWKMLPHHINLLKYTLQEKNQKLQQQVELDNMRNKMQKSSNAEDQSKLKFLSSCIEILVKVIGKLQERSPLRDSVVRSSSYLSRLNMIDDSEVRITQFNPLSANPTKWSNILKQFVDNLPTNCLSVLDHFVKLALKWLRHE